MIVLIHQHAVRLRSFLAGTPLRLTFLSNGALFGLSIVTSVLMARLLGPTDRGTVARIMYWPAITSGLFCLSLNEAVVIVLGRDSRRRSDRIRTALFLSGVLAVLASAALFVTYPFLLGPTSKPLVQQSRAFAFTFISVNLLSMILIAEDQSIGRFGRYNALRVLQQVCLLVGLVILWFTSTTTPPVMLLVIAASLAAPFSARIVNYLGSDSGRVCLSDVRELLRTGCRIQVLNVSGYISTQLDLALLSFLLPARDFGLYAVAMAVGSAHTSIIGPSLSAVEFPRLAALPERAIAMKQAMDAVKRPFRFSLACSVVVPPIALLAVPLVYGKDYSGAALPAVILSVGMGARSFRSYFSYAARAVGLLRIALIAEWAAAGATVVLLPVLVTWLGLTGATIGVTIANWLGLSVLLFQLSRNSGLSIRQFVFQREAIV